MKFKGVPKEDWVGTKVYRVRGNMRNRESNTMERFEFYSIIPVLNKTDVEVSLKNAHYLETEKGKGLFHLPKWFGRTGRDDTWVISKYWVHVVEIVADNVLDEETESGEIVTVTYPLKKDNLKSIRAEYKKNEKNLELNYKTILKCITYSKKKKPK